MAFIAFYEDELFALASRMIKGMLLIIAAGLTLILLGDILEQTVLPGALAFVSPLAIMGGAVATMSVKQHVRRRAKVAAKDR